MDGAAPLLEVDGLSARRGGLAVLKRVSFSVAPGEVVAVLGPNGSGKTTLLECIAGLCEVDAGQVRAGGTRLRTFRQHAERIAFQPDEIRLPDEMSVATALVLDRETPLVDELAVRSLVAVPGSELSRGEAKRVELCATLSSKKPILLLDEPLSVFDPQKLRKILPVLRRSAAGRAVVVTVHELRTAELVADRLILLVDGRVVATGTLAELRQLIGRDDASLEAIFLALLEPDRVE